MKSVKKYKSESWIDPRVELRSSSTEGKGLFARESIKKGETVIIWGGAIFTESDIKKDKAEKHSVVEIGEGIYLGIPRGKPQTLDDFMNHSCNPNLWLKDEVTLVARRNIEKDEELTADYATWVSRSYWQMECHCGSLFCRHLITGNDWKLKKLQNKYRNHFSPYLEKRIRKLK